MATHHLTADPTHSRMVSRSCTAPDHRRRRQPSTSPAMMRPVIKSLPHPLWLNTLPSTATASTRSPALCLSKALNPAMCWRSRSLEVAHKGWGWTSTIPGLGFLVQRFTEASLFHWRLDGDTSISLTPAIVPLRPFCGVMGVGPRQSKVQFRTRPPGVFGGNMDVRDLSTGATLYLPVLNPGALFSCGDAHAAQGDGEVCINGIECPADVTLRFKLHKSSALSAPIVEAPPPAPAPQGLWTVVESAGGDHPALDAARAATSRMIDLLADPLGVHASRSLPALQRRDGSSSRPGRQPAHDHGGGVDPETYPAS